MTKSELRKLHADAMSAKSEGAALKIIMDAVAEYLQATEEVVADDSYYQRLVTEAIDYVDLCAGGHQEAEISTVLHILRGRG